MKLNKEGQVFVARSSDDGLTFQEQSRVTPSNLNLQAANGVILSDGALAIAYGDHHRWNAAPRLIRPRDWLIVSGDAGKTFSEPLFITEIGGGKGWSFLDIANAGSSNPNRIFGLPQATIKIKLTEFIFSLPMTGVRNGLTRFASIKVIRIMPTRKYPRLPRTKMVLSE